METSVTDSVSPIRSIFTRQPDNPSVIVADGYGVKIHVQRGNLVIEDGIGTTRRTRSIPRVDATQPNLARKSHAGTRIARLVILSDTGFVTLEAIRWCADLGVSVTQLDRTGRLLMSSPGLGGDARLRTSQVHAASDGRNADIGASIYRTLIASKVSGQADIMEDIFSDSRTDAVRNMANRILNPALPDTSVLAIEGNAAVLYWKAWQARVFVPFDPTELKSIPAHWLTYESRKSRRNPQVPGGRNATDPVNAMLNYAYALCEKEARYACHVIGLDPALGFSHKAAKGTDTLVYDLIEVLRPYADRVVLSMLDTGKGIPFANGKPAYFKAAWLTETRDAICRLVAPLTHMLAERIPSEVAPIAGEHALLITRELSSAAKFKPRTPYREHTASTARLRTSKRPALASDVTPVDLVPDHVWEVVRNLIPPEPVVRGHKHPRADARIILAGILCHEVHGLSWRAVPASFGITGLSCRYHFVEWRDTGAWDTISKAIENVNRTHRGTNSQINA